MTQTARTIEQDTEFAFDAAGSDVVDVTAGSDPVSRFLAAVAAGDTDALVATLAADAEMVTPLTSRAIIRGREDLRVVFAAMLPTLSADLRWRLRLEDAGVAIAVADARLGGVHVEDAMLLETNAAGEIRRITPHVRPWLGLTVSAFVLGPQLLKRPAVMLRALRAGARKR